MSDGFYVYAIVISGRIAYIGKGSGARASTHLRASHNHDLRRKVLEARKAEIEPKVRILKNNLTEREAYSLERRWLVRFHERLTNKLAGSTTPGQRFLAQCRADLASFRTDEQIASDGDFNGVSVERRLHYVAIWRARLQRFIDQEANNPGWYESLA